MHISESSLKPASDWLFIQIQATASIFFFFYKESLKKPTDKEQKRSQEGDWREAIKPEREKSVCENVEAARGMKAFTEDEVLTEKPRRRRLFERDKQTNSHLYVRLTLELCF